MVYVDSYLRQREGFAMRLPGQASQIVLYDTTPASIRLERAVCCQSGADCTRKTTLALRWHKLPGTPARFSPTREMAICRPCLKRLLGISEQEIKQRWPPAYPTQMSRSIQASAARAAAILASLSDPWSRVA